MIIEIRLRSSKKKFSLVGSSLTRINNGAGKFDKKILTFIFTVTQFAIKFEDCFSRLYIVVPLALFTTYCDFVSRREAPECPITSNLKTHLRLSKLR